MHSEIRKALIMSKRLILISSALIAFSFFSLALFIAPSVATAQTSTQSSAAPSAQDQQLLSNVESYLRNLFGWGPEYKINLGPVTPAEIPDLLKIPVSVDHAGQNEKGTVYVTKDAHFMFRGEIRDMTKNPFA